MSLQKKVKHSPVNLDLTRCFYGQESCRACRSGLKGKKNAMAQHLDIHHPDNIGEPDCFDYSSVATFKKRLERQISEGVAIMKTDERVQKNRQQHILMNSKSEHKSLQPAIHRQVTVRGVRNGS